MSDEVVIVKGRLGWGNPGSGSASQFELYGPGDRWAPMRNGQRVHGGDLIADALAEAGASEGHQVLVIAIPRFANPAVLDAMEKAIRDGITYVLPAAPEETTDG